MNLKINRIIKNWKYASDIEYTTDYIKNNAGSGRRFAKQIINKDLWQKAFAEFNLYPIEEDRTLGSLLMNHYQDNTFTHLHKDQAPKGYVHIRANIMLKKPKSGGDVIIDDKIYNVNQNDLWLLLASLEEHGSTSIKNGERLIYSFGAIIEKQKIQEIINV